MPHLRSTSKRKAENNMARGDGRVFLRGATYWCAYYLRGVKFRESCNTSDENQANKFLRARLKEVHADEIGARGFETPAARRLTVHDLLDALKAEFELNGQDSPQNLSHLKRAVEDFGLCLAIGLSVDKITKYKKERQDKGDRPASINRPLQMIRQAYTLAIRREQLARGPYIKLLSEKGNARKGFCEETDFRKIHAHLPEYLQDFCLFGYCTGMRLGEVQSLKWEYVKGDVIELQAEDAKGDGDEQNARLIPMVGKDLAGVLKRRRAAQTVKTENGPMLAALIFHHDGNAIVDIRKAWQSAVIAAGFGKRVCPKCQSEGTAQRCANCKTKTKYRGRLFHDLRRSFCKNADEAGISRDVAMSISGHRTQETYTRYNICDVKRKRTALERVQEFRESQAAQGTADSNVVAIGGSR